MPRYSFVFAALMASLTAMTPIMAGRAKADVPAVVTDIAPVHALVAQVMQGLGTPNLILAPGASPHGYSLRPSQARDMQNADLVIWIGDELTPWLVKPLETLAHDAEHLSLLDAEGTLRLPYRGELALDHGADETHDGHDDGHDDAHDDVHEEGHEDGHDGGHEEHGHHDGTDPHAWLDPVNGAIWLVLIADRLATLDPENAALYQANAVAAADRLNVLAGDLSARLAPMRDRPFVAYHDGYQYFESRFDLKLAGTVAQGDATDPGPARLARLRELIETETIACAFTETQLNSRRLDVVSERASLKLLELDPLGAQVEPGPYLYETLLQRMADSFEACGRD